MTYKVLRQINVTNVFPTEQAPPGLNYYVPIKELPYSYVWDWDFFLNAVYNETPGMAGLKTVRAFGPEWANLEYLPGIERDQVQALGYNPIFNMHYVGNVVWGNEVQGSPWRLPDLMSGHEVVEDVSTAVNYLIAKKQFELFPELGQQLNMTAAKVSHVIRGHQELQNLYSIDPNDPYCYKIVEDWGWRIEVPILPLMAIKPIVLDIRYETKTGKVAFVMPNDCKETYAMWNLLFLGGAPRDLEILCAR
jgi:hypothetical protein